MRGRNRRIKGASELGHKGGKHSAVKDYHAKVNFRKRDACAALGSARTYLRGVPSRLERQDVCSSAGEPVNRRACNGRQLSFPLSSCLSHCSFSENAEGKATLGTSETSLYAGMFQGMKTGQTGAKRQELDHLDWHGDAISCISKAERTNKMVAVPSGAVNWKTAARSSISVNTSFPEGLRKSINCQATKEMSDRGQSMVKECQTYSTKLHSCSAEALQLPEDISDRSDPAETFSYVIDRANDISFKDQPVQCLMEQVDSHTAADTFKSEAGTDNEEQSAAYVLDCFKQKEHIKLSSALDVLNMQEFPLQSQGVNDGDGPDELVDVRVCDICGDVGREALLAICSKCGDGAEHIYCMCIKMDKVPEGDWMCEECMMVEEHQILQAEVDKSAEATNLSSLCKRAPVSGKSNSDVKDSDKNRLEHCSISHLPVKRPGPALQERPIVKRRALERDVQSQSLPGSIAKSVLHQSTLKGMNKGQCPAGMTSSFRDFSNKFVRKACSPSVDKSFKAKLHCAGGALDKSNSLSSSDLKLKAQPRGDDLQQLSKITEVTISHDMKGCVSRKLNKSISFSGPTTVHSDVSGLKTKAREDYKSPRNCLQNKMFRRSYSCKINSKEPKSPRDRSVISKLENKKVPVPWERNLGHSPRKISHHLKAIESNGNLKVSGQVAYKSSSHANVSVRIPETGSGEEKRSSSHGGNAISSVKTASSCHELKPNLSFREAKLECIPGDTSSLLRTTDKGLPDISSSMKDLLALPPVDVPLSAIPEYDCIWKGIFKLEKAGKLPSYSDGIQAHLSTSASSMVLDVALKFPHEILLTEASRLDTWPTQFEKCGATENNIALYFFAEDLQSYVRSYKKLLDCMVVNDLALKAEFDGVELLVFPSVMLPEGSQRWNNLLFLWGVFRMRKVSISDHLCASSPRTRIQIPSLNVGTSDQDWCTASVSGAKTDKFSAPMGGDLSPSHAIQKSIQAADLHPAASIGCAYQNCELEIPLEEKSAGLFADKVDMLTGPVENGQPPGNMQHSNYLQKEEGYHNRSLEMKHEGRNIVDFAVDEACYRTGNCVDGYKSHSCLGPHHSDGMFFLGVDDPSSKFLPKDGRHDAAHVVEMAESSRTSRSSSSLDSGPSVLSDSGEWSKSDELQMELLDRTLSLDLSLGNLTKLTMQGEPVLSLGLTSEGNDKPQYPAADKAEEDLSVSLSLALPGSNEGLMLEDILKAKQPPPEKDDVDLSLLLFGGIRNVWS